MRALVLMIAIGFLISVAILGGFLIGCLGLPEARLAAAYGVGFGIGSAWAWGISTMSNLVLGPLATYLNFWFNFFAAAFAALAVGYTTLVSSPDLSASITSVLKAF